VTNDVCVLNRRTQYHAKKDISCLCSIQMEKLGKLITGRNLSYYGNVDRIAIQWMLNHISGKYRNVIKL